MATKKIKRRASASAKKSSRKTASGSTFPAMSDLMKAIEENFRALAAMVPTGSTAKPKRKTKTKAKRSPASRTSASRTPASRTKTAVKRAAAQGKRAVARSKKAVRKTMPKKPAAKRTRRADKRPSAASPV